jgi:CubicO group peptidase (beta-lactamase class C family)
MMAASPASSEYGGSLWRREAHLVAPPLQARLPSDLVFFAGHMGQFVAIVPSKRLIVVRMGASLGDERVRTIARDQLFELVAALVTARR